MRSEGGRGKGIAVIKMMGKVAGTRRKRRRRRKKKKKKEEENHRYLDLELVCSDTIEQGAPLVLEVSLLEENDSAQELLLKAKCCHSAVDDNDFSKHLW